VTSPEQQVEFLAKVQRILAEGRVETSYKYALLFALGDIAVERGDHESEAPLVVPLDAIAEKFIAYYWRQVAPYPTSSSTVASAG
jgi:hypothetical protein